MDIQESIKIISAAIENFNESTDNTYNLQFDNNTILFGKGSVLDSIGLVNFIVSVEEEIENITGKSIVIGEDIVMTGSNNPLSSLKAFTEYIYQKIQE